MSIQIVNDTMNKYGLPAFSVSSSVASLISNMCIDSCNIDSGEKSTSNVQNIRRLSTFSLTFNVINSTIQALQSYHTSTKAKEGKYIKGFQMGLQFVSLILNITLLVLLKTAIDDKEAALKEEIDSITATDAITLTSKTKKESENKESQKSRELAYTSTMGLVIISTISFVSLVAFGKTNVLKQFTDTITDTIKSMNKSKQQSESVESRNENNLSNTEDSKNFSPFHAIFG
jgi:hypothetical protein